LGGLDLTRVWLDGEWWRVLTTGFLHGSLASIWR
jgi:membrane associated rhomboid family serine protease